MISQSFADIGWTKPAEHYERYYQLQSSDECAVLVAEWDGDFAGYVVVSRRPAYAFFRTEGIPEIQDLNVLPRYRRRGIGGRLMDRAEAIAAEMNDRVGIGVGFHPGYGAAQRMYVLRGYVPDARGAAWKGETIREGQQLVADDDLVLHMIKTLASDSQAGA